MGQRELVSGSEFQKEGFIEDLRLLRSDTLWLPSPNPELIIPGVKDILGVGIDIHLTSSAGVFLKKPLFAESVFTPDELEYCRRFRMMVDSEGSTQRFAAYFATKEAVIKAMGGIPGGIHGDLKEIEIGHNRDGQPFVTVSGDTLGKSSSQGISHFYVSYSHVKYAALAFCIAIGTHDTQDVKGI